MQQAMQILTSQNTTKWFTPPWLIDLVKEVQPIQFDPCTESIPQQWINAPMFYTEKENGLNKPWHDNYFLNPPFDNTPAWIRKAMQENKEGMILINSNLGYKWYEDLWITFPVFCFRERIAFANEKGIIDPKKTSKQGQTLVYTGNDIKRFVDVFARRTKNGQPLGRMIMTAKAMNQLKEQESQ